MKATIKIDASPREMRALLGLPDVEALQQELVEKLREKALAGIEANSPAELMKLLLPTADPDRGRAPASGAGASRPHRRGRTSCPSRLRGDLYMFV